MNVLVNGIGNIGSTLLALLSKYQNELGIDKIYALKNAPNPWNDAELEALGEKGIVVCSRNNDHFTHLDSIIDKVHYVFDCTTNGGGLKNKTWYDSLPAIKGACAQGSEKLFGTSFMSGINNEIISKEKYVHIVSCNSHAIASLLTTFCGKNLANLKESDFVIVRRSEDLGNHERLVSANVISRHMDAQLGTHHAIDALDLFKTIGLTFKVSSSDITTPSQLMHGVRFNISLNESISLDQVKQKIGKNSLVSQSLSFDSNVIFERGRRNGEQGRIYSHTIIISNNLMIVDNRIVGWAFIPQEGNTILSTIHAFLIQSGNTKHELIMDRLVKELTRKEW